MAGLGAPPFAPPLPASSLVGDGLAIGVAFGTALLGQADELRDGAFTLTAVVEVPAGTGQKGIPSPLSLEALFTLSYGGQYATGGSYVIGVAFGTAMAGSKAVDGDLAIDIAPIILQLAEAWWDMGLPDGIGYTDESTPRGLTEEQ